MKSLVLFGVEIGIVLSATLTLFTHPANGQEMNRPNRPNILIILADDLGYGDLGVYNERSLVPTPHLDKLASEGIRMTDAYCPVSVCSPSRYALMTGQYPWRSWKKSGVLANYEPSMIDDDVLTLPEMLQQAGYHTAGFGKWHLGASFPTIDGGKPAGYGKFKAEDNGANLAFDALVKDGPMDHGFDQWLGFSCASECWVLQDRKITGALLHDMYTIEAAPDNAQLELIPLEDYLPFITERSIDFLEAYEEQHEKPFFLYFAPYVPHIPLAVRKEFLGKTEAGAYGDYVHELDHYVGRLLTALDSLGYADNTLVLFASDNGSQFVRTGNDVDRSAGNNMQENAESLMAQAGHHPNAPLRGSKWTPFEGGVRTPLIARWPGHFPSGSVGHQLFALNDVMATLASVVGFELPRHSAVDSYDLLAVLMGEKKNPRKEVVIQSSRNEIGLRSGKWKYIGAGNYKPANPGDPAGELYDLSRDKSESVNLYSRYPKVVERMEKDLQRILTSSRSAR